MNDSLQITLGHVGFGLSNGSQVEKAFSNYCADLLLKLEGTVKNDAQISDRRPDGAQGIGGGGRRGFSKNNGLSLALIEVEKVCTHPCFDVSQTVKQWMECSPPINPEGEIPLDIV